MIVIYYDLSYSVAVKTFIKKRLCSKEKALTAAKRTVKGRRDKPSRESRLWRVISSFLASRSRAASWKAMQRRPVANAKSCGGCVAFWIQKKTLVGIFALWLQKFAATTQPTMIENFFFEKLRNTEIYHDVSRYIMMYHDTTRCITIYHDICASILNLVASFRSKRRIILIKLVCLLQKPTTTQMCSFDYKRSLLLMRSLVV